MGSVRLAGFGQGLNSLPLSPLDHHLTDRAEQDQLCLTDLITFAFIVVFGNV